MAAHEAFCRQKDAVGLAGMYCRESPPIPTGTSYTLEYVPGAVAVTDVPQTTADLLKQRKRWLNGALFALFYAFMHAKQFYTRYSRRSRPLQPPAPGSQIGFPSTPPPALCRSYGLV